MSVPDKVLMRKIKKREKTKLNVLKRREEQKDAVESAEKAIEISQEHTEDIPPRKKRKF